ncbi:MAG TPA: tail fiber domain-containing protein, partial [Sphingobium sp.]|nr:tail fiber domain-containing protein [Sphingobium sp.]
CVEDFPFLARSTLLIDSRAAFVQACQFVADSGGGVVEAPGVYYCSDDIEVPNGVTIEGQVRAAEIGISGSPFAFGTRRSRISLSAGKHIILRNWSGLKGLIIHRHGLAVGEDPNTWTGTAVLVRGAGTVQDDLVVLGFAKWCDATSSVDGERCSRLRASRVLLDCQAGISISYCYDIPYLYEIHGNALTGTTTLLRNGIGIDFNTDVDWPRATNCFFYGYATGIRVNSANDAILTNCGTDYVPGEASTSDGVLVSGTARCCKLIGHQAAAQGAGIKVDNGAAYQPVVVVIGASFWANDTDGIRVISGNLICVASTFLDGARAIRVDDTNTAATASVHITQCLFKGVAAALTIPDAVLNASHIADNHFINCADATIGSVHTFAAGVRDATTFRSFNATAVGPRTIQDHARGTAAAPVIVNDGDQTFSLIGRAWTGAAWAAGGQVRGQVTGAPSTTSMPARLIFSTVPVGAIVATDRWNMTTAGHFEPIAGNAYALGSNSLPVSNIYSQNAVTVVSDERAKTDITDSTLGLAFINALRPVSYRQKVGAQIVVGQDYCDLFGNPVEDPGVDDVPGELIIENRPGVRRHFGLIAQDVKALIDAAGVDFGGFVMEDPDDPESRQALRYEQFIAPLIKAVQELSAQNLALTDRVAGLEAANA